MVVRFEILGEECIGFCGDCDSEDANMQFQLKLSGEECKGVEKFMKKLHEYLENSKYGDRHIKAVKIIGEIQEEPYDKDKEWKARLNTLYGKGVFFA